MYKSPYKYEGQCLQWDKKAQTEQVNSLCNLIVKPREFCPRRKKPQKKTEMRTNLNSARCLISPTLNSYGTFYNIVGEINKVQYSNPYHSV